MPFRILTVCTGNVCRSPQAEQLLRSGFTAALISTKIESPEISSAGTHALIGQAMPEQAAALSLSFGGDPSAHEPRQLSAEIIAEADLVLAMSREHRSAVARLLPRAIRRTFTLREFARALDSPTGLEADSPSASHDSSDFERFSAWSSFAARNRGLRPGAPDLDDVVDPFGRDYETYLGSIKQIAPAVSYIVSRLTDRNI